MQVKRFKIRIVIGAHWSVGQVKEILQQYEKLANEVTPSTVLSRSLPA